MKPNCSSWRLESREKLGILGIRKPVSEPVEEDFDKDRCMPPDPCDGRRSCNASSGAPPLAEPMSGSTPKIALNGVGSETVFFPSVCA
jgi:hypothetical protein